MGDGSMMARRLERMGAMAATCLLVAGCLSSPSDVTPLPTAGGSATPRTSATSRPTRTGPTPVRSTTFALAIDSEPLSLSPAERDPASRLIDRFLFTALYRLDERLKPRPDLAAGLPFVDPDGLHWSVTLRSGVRFHDGSRLDAGDVAFTYQLALSPDCPFGELCTIARDGLAAVSADGDLDVHFELREPDASLLATLLGQLPILPQDVLEASEARFLAGAGNVGSDAVTALVEQVDTDTNADACLKDVPPPECTLAAHLDALEAMLRMADLPLPPRAAFPDGAGGVDTEAYAATLLERVQLLGSAISSSGIDQSAAAFPLLDFGKHPVGTGAFRFDSATPGQSIDLRRFDDAMDGPAPIGAVHIAIISDPRIAATALKTGEIDWLPAIGAEQVSELSAEPSIRVGGRPGPGVRMIVFNVRPDRLYADPAARRAFATCLDKGHAVTVATGGRADAAWTPTTPGSWAFAADLAEPAGDPDGARRILEAARWTRGGDGIYSRGGRRLSSELFVRATRGDQLDFATDARDQLAACGIELVVRELDLSGGALLDQLQWPNDFDTVLVTRDLGLDPDADFAPYESRHITTQDDPGDLNIGGWSNAAADALLSEGRQASDPEARAASYVDLQHLLVREVPIYPLWYERVYGGLSARVAGPARTIDLATPRYDWDVDRWQLVAQ